MSNYILASQSPRRKQLLEWAEIDFEIMIHPTDETYPPGLQPAEVAVYIAQQKAQAVAGTAGPGKVIIAADTIVVLDGAIIGKPKSREDGLFILAKLSGRQHQVITGVSIRQGEKELSFSDSTYVDFHPLSQEQIEFYFDKYQPFDKAGAYAIQEWIGVVGIRKVSGDFYNVMGLPVSRVVQVLREFPG